MGLLATISADSSFGLLSIYMVVLGVGVGMLMQNLVLAAQNDVPASELGAATSVLSFFRSLGGAIGTSALGAVLSHRVASEMEKGFGGAADNGGAGHGVPDLAALPESARQVVEHAYGVATADVFLIGAPFAFLALIAVLFIKEKPLKTQSGMERLAEENAAAAKAPAAPAH